MDTTHIQTLIAIAERAQQRGIILLDETPAVFQAVQAAKQALKQASQPEPEPPNEGAKAKKSG